MRESYCLSKKLTDGERNEIQTGSYSLVGTAKEPFIHYESHMLYHCISSSWNAPVPRPDPARPHSFSSFTHSDLFYTRNLVLSGGTLDLNFTWG